MKKSRKEIAAELMRGCPSEAKSDHLNLANMLRNGASADEILDSDEAGAWPDTYFFLKNELEIETNENEDEL